MPGEGDIDGARLGRGLLTYELKQLAILCCVMAPYDGFLLYNTPEIRFEEFHVLLSSFWICVLPMIIGFAAILKEERRVYESFRQYRSEVESRIGPVAKFLTAIIRDLIDVGIYFLIEWKIRKYPQNNTLDFVLFLVCRSLMTRVLLIELFVAVHMIHGIIDFD